MDEIRLATSAVGIKEQVTRFTNMSGNFEAWKIAEIVNFCLQDIEDGARARAPVITGFLRNSIGHFMISEDFPVIAGETFVGAEYGMAVEYGYINVHGSRIPGKNYFTPAAIKGQNLLKKIMKDYISQTVAGKSVTPPSATRGKGKSTKYQAKRTTSTGKTSYKYGPDRGTISRRYFVRLPGGRKQPTTGFARPRGGSSSFRRG